MTDESDIPKLVAQSAAGNAEAFRVLYEHLAGRVFAYIRSRTSREEAAIDVTQDAFIELYTSLPKFQYQSQHAWYAYVFTIVRRTLARHYETNKHHRSSSQTDIDPDTLPDKAATLQDDREDVYRALCTLDDISRDIVVLHHWSLHTFPEIAAMLVMQESAVRVRHHRAMQSLRTYFDKQTP